MPMELLLCKEKVKYSVEYLTDHLTVSLYYVEEPVSEPLVT